MQNRDLNNQIDAVSTIAPALIATSITGAGVSIAGYTATAVLVHVGTITDGTHTLSIQDSDDDVTYAAVAAGRLNGTAGVLASDTVTEIGYLGTKQFLRAVVTVTGSPTTGGTYGALVVRGSRR